MLHKATVTTGKLDGRPFHVECACGVAGDFLTEQDAGAWIATVHFRRIGASETSELASQVPAEPEPPAEPEGLANA